MSVCARYDVHGVMIGVDADDPMVVAALERRLGAFRTDVTGSSDVRLRLGNDSFGPPSGRGRPVYDAPAAQVMYFKESDELYVEYLERVRLRCDATNAVIQLAWPTGDAEDVWWATHPLLTIALLEVLKRRGRYGVHAGCAALNGRGVVVAGPSGAGKSTLAMALSRAGWEFLSDDLVFLTTGPGGLEVLGFPDEIDVTDHTLAMFPELAPSARAPEVAGREKRSFRVEEALGRAPRFRCSPGAVVMPRVANTGRSWLAPVAAGEALVELAPNVLLTEAASTDAHLRALGELAATVPCFRLESGRDLDRIPWLLGELLR